TQPIVLCFGGDAAGEAATLRGMELAAAQGFEVRVVPLPAGLDPADLADGFEERIARATSYLLHRVRLEVERAPDRQEAFVRAREVLTRFEDSPERQKALRFVADRLDLPKETPAGLAPRAAAAAAGAAAPGGARGRRTAREARAAVGARPHPRGGRGACGRADSLPVVGACGAMPVSASGVTLVPMPEDAEVWQALLRAKGLTVA